MRLRNIENYFYPGARLASPGAVEFDPNKVDGIECVPEQAAIVLHFNASTIVLQFMSNMDGTPPRIYEIKDTILAATRNAARKHAGLAPAVVEHAAANAGSVVNLVDRVADKMTRRSDADRGRPPMPDKPVQDMDGIDKQNVEFNALCALVGAYDALPPVVDDDYPEMRHKYETQMRTFIDAIKLNGRIP